MKEIAIEIKNVSFSYATPKREEFFDGFSLPIKRVVSHSKKVLSNISLEIQANKITALLGKNGSGKTSLIKLISGVRVPDSGTIRVFGLPPNQARHLMGVCLGGSLIYYRLTARENLEYFARLYGVTDVNHRIDELTEMLELHDFLDDMVETFSFGMKAKLALARSLIHAPRFLILDEPTLGIDLHLATQLREFVKRLKCTVLLTTHYMEEAQTLADDLCLIDKGLVHDFGSKEEVLGKYHANQISDVFLQATGS